jgi:hypothetical protein
VSSHMRFDLAGFSRAIEERDAQYQLAVYADNAEVQIVDSSNGAEQLRRMHGKAAIRDWVEEMCAPDVTHHVVSPEASEAHVTLVEERLNQDGTKIRYSCTAEVVGGQITREIVTLTERGVAAVGEDRGAPRQGGDNSSELRRSASVAAALRSVQAIVAFKGSSMPSENFLG